MIHRSVSEKILYLAQKFPVVSLTGPRQSGKTTLVRELFPDYAYLTLENPSHRQAAKEAPLAFLRQNSKGIIIDEAQYVPEIFSYVQLEADEHNKSGEFILCGSQHFLMMEKITQSLAGRVAIFNLLPLSFAELQNTEYKLNDYISYIFKGFFPRIYDKQIYPTDYYPNYIQTYVERDARQVVNITDLGAFQTFIQLCAGRIGQLFNQSETGSLAGIDQKTARRWLTILETGFQVFTLRPYFKNFDKRIIKTPKIYFWDTGLACSLLGIQTEEELLNHYARGALFENFIIVEMIKKFYNKGIRPNVYFWRDHSGHEIDLLFDIGGKLYPMEIKSGQVLQKGFFSGLNHFVEISGAEPRNACLIYGGDQNLDADSARVRSWNNLPEVV
ncbi:MAG: ATP-binding protein [Bacteroidia bacterium]|nr:ATP-binding protein [Bacteroidia bacterium]